MRSYFVLVPFMFTAVISTAAGGGRAALGAEVCRFSYQPPHVGQQVQQDVHFVLAMILTVSEDGQIVEETEEGAEWSQQRRLTVLEADGNRTTRVRLSYPKAEHTRAEAGEVGPTKPQSVVGKTYIVARDASGQLHVANEKGESPPAPELAIIQQNMVGLGRPNPLAQFLAGRTFEVGSRVPLPPELAQELLGMPGALGEIQRVELLLRERQMVGGRSAAVFEIEMEARPVEGRGIGMQISGELVVEVDTCRAISANFLGPVSLVETDGPEEQPRLTRGQGTLNVVVKSQYSRPQVAESPRQQSRFRR